MYVDPGDLNKRIQIVQKLSGEEYDDEGLPIKSERIVRTCWAKVTNTSGSELIKAGSEFSEAKKRFLVRYTSTPITTAMVVRYRSREPVGQLADDTGEYLEDSVGNWIMTDADGIAQDYDILYVNTYGDNREYLEIWTKLGQREV